VKESTPDVPLVQGHTPQLIQGGEIGAGIDHVLQLREITPQHVKSVHEGLGVVQAASDGRENCGTAGNIGTFPLCISVQLVCRLF